MILYNRKTYGFLDWLGDLGGFYGAIAGILAFINGPNSNFALQAKLMSLLVHARNDKDSNHIKENNFQNISKIFRKHLDNTS